jgi:pentatricopeptide repeat protein
MTMRRFQQRIAVAAVQSRRFALNTAVLRSAAATGNHGRAWAPFSEKDESELVRVIRTKPRHVLKHVRQQVWRSRKKEVQFRNTVTQLMIVLQEFLRKQLLDPASASSIIESVLEECVRHAQHDMAHLLFRALLRFRKYGCTVTIDSLRYLFESYRENDSSELMLQIANELKAEPEMRPFCIAAFLFGGQVDEAEAMFQAVPLANLTAQDIVAIVEGYVQHGMTEKILSVINKLSELPGKTTDDTAVVFRAALRGLDSKRNAEGFQAVLTAAIMARVPLDNNTFTTILRHKVRLASSTDDIAAIETELKSIGYVPDIAGNSVIIAAYSRLQHFGDKGSEEIMLAKVDTLLSSIEVRLKQPDPDMDITAAHLRAVIRGYGAAGRSDLIKAAWQRMQCKGISDDTRVYNELLKWYSGMGNVREVLETKEEMTAQSVMCNTQTYSFLFRVLGKFYPRQVERYYAEMLDRRVRPDIALYTSLVGIFGDLGNMSRVEEIIDETRRREAAGTIEASPFFYAVLIRLFSKDVKRATELYEEAKQKNVAAHDHVQTALLSCYASSPDAKELLDQALANLSGGWSADVYNIVLNMHAKAGDAAKVTELFEKMKADNVQMNHVTYGTLVTAFSRLKDTARITEVVDLMKEKEGQVSASFYAVLASSLARLGDKEGVNDAWEDLASSKLFPNTEVFNHFLQLYGRTHNAGKMRGVLESMMKFVPPNPVTATTVLDLLGKTGRITEMEQLFEDMKGNADTAPTAVTYHQMLNAYAKSGDVPKMERVLLEMREKGITENNVTFNILTDGYGRAKRFEALADVVARRKAAGVPLDEFGYCVILSAYGKAKLTGEVDRVLAQLVEENPTMLTRRILWVAIDAYCRVAQLEKMDKWAKEIAALNQDGVLSPQDKAALVSYYARTGAMEKAEALANEIEAAVKAAAPPPAPNASAPNASAGFSLPYSVLNSLARGFAKVGRFEDTVRLLHVMRDRHFVPDVSTTMFLSSCFIKAGLHEQAQQVVLWRRQFSEAGGEEAQEQ